MDKVTLERMATNAFTQLTATRDYLFSAVEAALEVKTKLDTEEASAMASGQFDGKNAETRKAQAREHFDAQYVELAQVESAERAARYHFDIAQIDVDTVKTLLRIAELTE